MTRWTKTSPLYQKVYPGRSRDLLGEATGAIGGR